MACLSHGKTLKQRQSPRLTSAEGLTYKFQALTTLSFLKDALPCY